MASNAKKKIDRRGCPPGAGIVAGKSNGKPAGRIGNPPHEVTEERRELVRAYSKVMGQEMIASALGVSVDTLQRHYRDELDSGKREAIAAVGGKLLQKALKGNLTAQIFYLRTQGGWSTKHEVSGPGGAPLQPIDMTAFLDGRSEDECKVIYEFLTQLFDRVVSEGNADESGADPKRAIASP